MPANTITANTTFSNFVNTYNSHVANTNAIEIVANSAFNTANSALQRAGGVLTGTVTFPAANSTIAPLIIPHGSPPASPANGTIWTSATGLFAVINTFAIQLATGASANAAQVTADLALTNANNAQATANTARLEANTAQATANTARLEANTAQATANTALLAANSAQATANLALARTGGTMTGNINMTAGGSYSIAKLGGFFSPTTFGSQLFKWSDDNLYFDNYDGQLIFRRLNNAITMVLAANGNIGIANSNPTERLHVTGNIFASGTITSGGNTTVTGTLSVATASLVGNDTIAASEGITARGTTPILQLRADSAAVNQKIWRFASDSSGVLRLQRLNDAYNSLLSEPITVLNSGNVGIGITNPLYRLHVAGTIEGDAIRGWNYFVGPNNTAGSGQWAEIDLLSGFTANNRFWNIAAVGGDGSFVIRTFNDARSPLIQPLTIDRNGQFSQQTVQVGTTQWASQRNHRWFSSVGNGSILDIQTQRHIAGSDWTGTLVRIGRMVDSSLHGFIDFGISGVSSSVGLGFGTAGAANRMVIDGAGNVGINSLTPPAKLTIGETGQTNAGGMAIGHGGVHLILTQDPATNGGKIQVHSGGSTSALGTTPYRLLLQPEGGTVGIGTTAPGALLHVAGTGLFNGNVTIAPTSGFTGNIMTAPSGASSGSYHIHGGVIRWTQEVGASLWTVNRFNGSGTYLGTPLTLDNASGFVGINITAPTDNFTVVGNMSVGINPDRYIFARDAASGFLWLTGTQSAFSGYSFRADNGSRTIMHMLNNGNVRIGNGTNAGAPLDVSAGVALDNTTHAIIGDISKTRYLRFHSITGSNNTRPAISSHFDGSNSNRYDLALNPEGGNITVGTNLASVARLHVVGAGDVAAFQATTEDSIVWIDQTQASATATTRPVLQFRKQGTTRYQISADGSSANAGGVYHEVFGANPHHAWFVPAGERMRLTPVGLGIGTPGGDFGRDWRLIARQDQNSTTRMGVINTTVGAAAVCQFALIGGTGNSFTEINLQDGNGAPFVNIDNGSAIARMTWRFNTVERLNLSWDGALTAQNLITARGTGTNAAFRTLNSIANRDYRIMQKDDGRFLITDETAGSERFALNPDGSFHFMAPFININGVPTRGIVRSGEIATTSGTSIDATGIPSGVNRITVLIRDLSTNGTSPPQLQLRQLGLGPVTTNYQGIHTSTSGSSSGVITSSGAHAGIRLFLDSGWMATSGFMTARMVLDRMALNFWVYSLECVRTDSSAWWSHTKGYISLGNWIDGIRLTTVNGTDTFDSGAIMITWE